MLRLLPLLVLLAGCESLARLAPEPEPKAEARSRAGNKSPYTVFGQTYQVLPSAAGYAEEGVASWYGRKFHGRKTSNGETFNMFAVSAAHKSLPIPTFVKITNLDNGRELTVRINDRGPFVKNRLIDLSYAAAAKLDMIATGTARVRVEAVPVANEAVLTLPPAPQVAAQNIGRYLQIGVFSNKRQATNLAAELESAIQTPVIVKPADRPGLFRVAAGPLATDEQLERVKTLLQFKGYEQAFIIYEIND